MPFCQDKDRSDKVDYCVIHQHCTLQMEWIQPLVLWHPLCFLMCKFDHLAQFLHSPINKTKPKQIVNGVHMRQYIPEYWHLLILSLIIFNGRYMHSLKLIRFWFYWMTNVIYIWTRKTKSKCTDSLKNREKKTLPAVLRTWRRLIWFLRLSPVTK